MASNPSYHNANSPYASGDPYYAESTGYITPMPMKKRTSNWIKFGIPVLIVVIVGAVVGGVLGSRAHNKNSSASGSTSSSGDDSSPAAASSAVSQKNAVGAFATATNSEYLLPIYPSTTNTAVFTTSTFKATSNSDLAFPKDSFQPSNPSATSPRPDRPRLIAPAYKWQALPNLIKNDPYLKTWNDTIFGNATQYYGLPPVVYHMDGSSGILDNAREIKMRVKAFSYVYRMTNDTKWVDRTWSELQNAVSDSFGPNDDTKWNPAHFLDTAEFTAAFAIAYDWLNDILTDDQKTQIRSNMIQYGLNQGVIAINNTDNQFHGWWTTNITGNWNCVCNGGLTLGSLAILGDDTSGIAENLLAFTIPNARDNCAMAVSSDGTWAETANYWYFGTTGYSEMVSALMTATGSDYNLLKVNPNFQKTGQSHMSVTGPGSLFAYGDHGPNKFSTTANGMFLFASSFNHPEYALFQRDQHDAPEPWSMFWYDPTVSGAFWNGANLDTFFDDSLDQWAMMRSSWTDENALYAAIKAGKLQGHQTHNDLDCGDFVIDALSTRWAGELGSGDYLSDGYFSNDTQASERWQYYRKASMGQNVILVNKQNQLVTAAPTVKHQSSNTAQGSSTVEDVPSDSTAWWSADLSSAYSDVTSYKRALRMINARKQVLLQDEITASQPMLFRFHTNATVSVDDGNTSATLKIGDQSMKIQLLNPSSDMQISTGPAERFSDGFSLPAGQVDQPNPGVTVVTVSMDAGTKTLEMLFNPQWPGMSDSDFKTPPSVPIDQWSLTSHDN